VPEDGYQRRRDAGRGTKAPAGPILRNRWFRTPAPVSRAARTSGAPWSIGRKNQAAPAAATITAQVMWC